jgi:aminopeptidase S
VNLSSYAGQAIQLQVEAADLSTASLVEAAVDDVRISRG